MEILEKIKITKEMVLLFSDLTGDKNPIHLDEEYCKSTKFKKPIAHGMLISSFFSKLIAERYPGPGSIYLSQNISFVSPCYVGDEINIKISLNNKVDNKFYLDTLVYNTNGDLIIIGDAIIKKYD